MAEKTNALVQRPKPTVVESALPSGVDAEHSQALVDEHDWRFAGQAEPQLPVHELGEAAVESAGPNRRLATEEHEGRLADDVDGEIPAGLQSLPDEIDPAEGAVE